MTPDTSAPRDTQRSNTPVASTTEATEAPAPVRLAAAPGLQALDLGLDASVGMVCDIDDPDCNPMAFAGTSGASTSTGGADEA